MSEASENKALRAIAFLDSILAENVRLGGFNLLTLPIVLLRIDHAEGIGRWIAIFYALFFTVSSIAYGVIVVHLMKKHRNYTYHYAFSSDWTNVSGRSSVAFQKINGLMSRVFSVTGSAGIEMDEFLRNLKPWRDWAYFPQIGMIISFAAFLIASATVGCS